jgi:hypothetical protein
VAKPQHRTPEYRAAYAELRRLQSAGVWLTCVEPKCHYRTRAISPSAKASVSHDPSGLVITGYSHLKCNLSEAATRGNRMRARRRFLEL